MGSHALRGASASFWKKVERVLTIPPLRADPSIAPNQSAAPHNEHKVILLGTVGGHTTALTSESEDASVPGRARPQPRQSTGERFKDGGATLKAVIED